MMEAPLVSIVTPSFNKGSYIEETILSVLNQDYPNIEYIVIDGGSTDGTLGILEKYSNRIHWISEPDRGQSDAINKGWKLTRGEIIAYLNADDTYTNDAVSTAVTFFMEHPDIAMIYGNGILTDENGKLIRLYNAGPFTLRDLICCRDNILQPAVFLRREVYSRIGGIDESLHLAMDLDYWIRTGLSFRIAYLPHSLATAKIYRDAKSVAQMHGYIKDYERILEKVFSDPHIRADVAGWKREAYHFVYVKGGLDYLHLFMFLDGFAYLWKAFRMDPVATMKTTARLVGNFLFKQDRTSD